MEMHEYVDILTGQMRSKKAGKMVAEEIRAHIEDQAQDYEESGMSRESAVQEAVRQMGDPVEAGVALDRIHRPRMNYKMALAVVIVSMLGLVLQYQSMRGYAAADGGLSGSGFIIATAGGLSGSSLVIVAAGIICMFLICFLDYTFFYQYAPMFFAAFAAFAWIGIRMLPVTYGGYIYLGQYIYLFLPLYGALLYRLRGCRYPALLWCIGFMAAAMFAVGPLFYVRFAFRFGLAALCMTSLAIIRGWYRGNKKWMLALTWGIPLASGMSFLYRFLQGNNYQSMRLRIFLKMEPDTAGIHTFYLEPIRELLGRLQWFGMPDSGQIWADFMATPAGSNGYLNLLYLFLSKGILIGVTVIALYLLCWFYLLRVSLRQKNELGRLVGFGCTMLLGIETFAYVFMNFGMLYPGSNVMPFFQPGRLGTVIYYFLLGIVLSIYRYQDVLPAQPRKVNAHILHKYRISLRIEKV